MNNVTPVSPRRFQPAAAWRRLGILPLLIVIVGCGTGGSGTVVSGKVTHKGDPVNDELVFVDAKSKEYKAPVMPDGTYSIADLPLGDYKVLVKPGLAPVMGGGAKSGGAAPGVAIPETIKGGAGEMPKAVPPPAKYAMPDNGLTYTVKAGKQQKDFQLE